MRLALWECPERPTGAAPRSDRPKPFHPPSKPVGGHIDADLFYDANVVGIEVPDDEPIPPEWKLLPDREHPLPRLARNPFALGGILFGLGFFTVFVDQAPFLVQVVLGAPIFEEFVKFGLALLLGLLFIALMGGLATRERWRHRAWLLVMLPAALAIGAGFGILEHAVSYSEEDTFGEFWRIGFHATSTGLSMVTLYAVASWRDPRVRWFAPLPSIIIHYANNASAVLLSILSIAAPIDDRGVLSALLVLIALGMLVAFLLAPGSIRRGLGNLAKAHLPDRTTPLKHPR